MVRKTTNGSVNLPPKSPTSPVASGDRCEAYSITEFCRAHGFSRASYYNLPPEDRPREMRVGSRKLISKEAAADWRARMETYEGAA